MRKMVYAIRVLSYSFNSFFAELFYRIVYIAPNLSDMLAIFSLDGVNRAGKPKASINL